MTKCNEGQVIFRNLNPEFLQIILLNVKMSSICFTGSFKLELFKVWHIKSFFGLTAGLKEVTACVRNVLVNLRDASR